MTTIYLVTEGCYSDYMVRGAFSTKEKAEYAKKLFAADNDIEEYQLDELPEHPQGMFWYEVRMLINGDVVEATTGDAESTWKHEWCPAWDESVKFGMWAEDEKAAIKVANERRIRLIESEEWTTDWNVWKAKRP